MSLLGLASAPAFAGRAPVEVTKWDNPLIASSVVVGGAFLTTVAVLGVVAATSFRTTSNLLGNLLVGTALIGAIATPLGALTAAIIWGLSAPPRFDGGGFVGPVLAGLAIGWVVGGLLGVLTYGPGTPHFRLVEDLYGGFSGGFGGIYVGALGATASSVVGGAVGAWVGTSHEDGIRP